MKTIKTSELTGAALDWAVAKCEGAGNIRRNIHPFNDDWLIDWPGEDGRKPRVEYLAEYSPSNSRAQGGPIIEREGIEVQRGNPIYFPQGNEKGEYYEPLWLAMIDLDKGDAMVERTHGRTVLEAAMRCFVASQLGDTVEIPDGLT